MLIFSGKNTVGFGANSTAGEGHGTQCSTCAKCSIKFY